jgi:acetylornithine/N-succinyldiaminopimelate aminotransferase
MEAGPAVGMKRGFPFGACLATEAAAESMTPGTHGTTFGGNPLAMAVGNAVLDVVLAPGFLDQVARTGLILKQRLAAVIDQHPRVFELVRGEGLMLGLKCRPPAADVIAAMRAERLLGVAAGDNVVRLLPPLIIGEAEVAEAMGMLEAAARRVEAALDAAAAKDAAQ